MITILNRQDLVPIKRNSDITNITTTSFSYQALQSFYNSNVVLFHDTTGKIKILKNQVTFDELCSLIESMRNLQIASGGILPTVEP